MAAIDDLTELVERAAAVEKVALSSKWRERADVTKLIARVRKNAEEQRDELTRNVDPAVLSSRWVSLRRTISIWATRSRYRGKPFPQRTVPVINSTGRVAG